MPSSITLTVSYLPQSTSFFLSALQPLNYAYRGQSGSTVGFGPINSSAPADFWLTQEIPGVPAGAAHVAFPASNHHAVQDFFTAALKAGGKIHGEPACRDASGYYSAAIIDFDGNSIEAVYRPSISPDSDKENMSVVSKRTTSKAPTAVSRVPSSVSKARSVAASRTPSQTSRAPTQAPSAVPSRQPSPPKGDALDQILTQATATADVARNLVNSVRPNLTSTKSAPPSAQPQSHEPSDAIVGTLLGVAAGAALHFAFSNRTKSNSSPDSSSGEDRGRRPSMSGRSATMPAYDYAGESTKSLYSRGGGKYITMEDNDYASTVKAPTNVSRRRGSIDSGIGISPPSSASRKSGKGTRMIEAPPSAYRAPTVITSVTRQTSACGKRSSSVGREGSKSGRERRRESEKNGDMQTVVHVQEFGKVRSRESPVPSQVSTVKPVRSGKEEKGDKRSSRRPEDMPLPPSRAATWADGHDGRSEASYATAKSGGGKTIMGLEKLRSEASRSEREKTKSVVGKLRDIKRLDVGASEVGPMDSVSQVSSSRGSRRSRR